MNPFLERQQFLTRRHFFSRMAAGIGTAALGSMLNPRLLAGDSSAILAGQSHFRRRPSGSSTCSWPAARRSSTSTTTNGDGKAPRSGSAGLDPHGPAADGHDYSGQKRFAVVKSLFKFSQHGKCGTWFSELIPNIASLADDVCVIKTVNTEAINHDPAITFIQTGFQQPGRPCVGSWLHYGLGTENQNLPSFIVMISNGKESDQPLYTRLWGSGFLPSEYQGVQFRARATRCCSSPTRRASMPRAAAGCSTAWQS